MPEVFGISHNHVPLLDYLNAGLRPNSFVGWLEKKGIGFAGLSVNDGHIWYFYWLEYEWATLGRGIKTATDNAGQYPQVFGITLNDLRVFGCWELGVNDYNQN
jgi:hypothetical protein